MSKSPCSSDRGALATPQLSRYFLLCVGLLAASAGGFSFAQEPGANLLAQPFRPRMAELQADLQPWPKENPFRDPVNPSDGRRRLVGLHGPRAVAELEMAYPGATWAVLGRGAAFLGDLLDGFYRAQGQPNRVLRLNASRETFAADPKRLASFLLANGLASQTQDLQRPFVIIDQSSFSETAKSVSQTVQLLNAAYSHYRQQGGRAQDLVTKVNVISLLEGPFTETIVPGVDLAEFFHERRKEAAGTGRPQRVFFSPAAGKFTDLADWWPWHGAFGPIDEFNGVLSGTPGELSPLSLRRHILAELFEVVGVVSKDTFLEKVKKEALALGYDFPASTITGQQQLHCSQLLVAQ